MWRLAALAAAAVALVIVPFLLFGPRLEAAAAGWMDAGYGAAGAAALVVALLAADIVLPVPSSIVATAAGAMLGFAAGAAAVFAGLTLSSAIGFLAGRRWGPAIVRRFAGEESQRRVEDWVERHGTVAAALTRAVPVLAETVAVLAGTGRLRATPFFLGTGAANLGLALVYAGAGAASASEADGTLAFAASIALPAIAWLAWRLASRRHAHPAG